MQIAGGRACVTLRLMWKEGGRWGVGVEEGGVFEVGG